MASATHTTVAIGPVMPGWGSWDWVGTFLVEHLGGLFRTTTFGAWDEPEGDAVLVVKHAPPPEWAHAVTRRASLVYCPIDHYGAAAEIEDDAEWLRACAKILVHCRRLEPYFAPLAPTAYVDHPLKFAVATRRGPRPDGPFLWVGVRSNLGPLTEWVNAHPLPGPLDVLTNPETPGAVPGPVELGFRAGLEVRVHEWSPERHRQFAAVARAALDVKRDDFRARHKPPAKALDFVASGLPLAMNPGTSSAEHLAELGLKVPSPLDTGTWLSERYAQDTRRLGERLTRELAPARVANRVRKLVEEALRNRPTRVTLPVTAPEPEERYRAIQDRLARGEYADARPALESLDAADTPVKLRALVRNDLAALAALDGDHARAGAGFRAALELDPDCAPAAANLTALTAPEPGKALGAAPVGTDREDEVATSVPHAGPTAVKVAVLSVLFNWPSTGGGTVHSAELTKFLAAAGYEVRHLYARFEPWGVGRVTVPTPFPAEPLEFTEAEWTTEGIVARFRAAVDAFDPDWVVLTDSWNLKPVLARAAGNRPYVLRLQALECLCPLNNVRLLPGPNGEPRQCTRHQLATPDACARCVHELGHTSGDLHRAERALAGVGTPGYRAELFAAFEGAAAVLAVNPLTAAMVEPHARDVRVVTAGMDPDRFPWPFSAERRAPPTPGRLRVLFAGLTHEWMKGFHVLRAAAARLWEARTDFEVVVTDAAPDGPAEPWARYIGWQSQADLPGQMAGADIVVVPTVAQEALGRTAVEAMAAGKPVVASRIGGLLFTVVDGATGLLCPPGEPDALSGTLARLLDDAPLRARLGEAGRARFEEHFAWPAIIARHYRPLFGEPVPVGEPVPLVVEPPPPAAPDPRPRVGCVLAVRDRSPEVLERTLQTYQWQTVPAADRVLVDYGSEPGHARAYEDLCARYGWRRVRCEPPEPRWHLADAYNRAVAALDPRVEVLFKSDTDVLLGPEVLGVAARRGAAAFCQFRYLTLPRDVDVPAALTDSAQLGHLLERLGKNYASAGQGLFACPVAWFRDVGGFDRAYRTWGFEDHDLRARAELALPVADLPWREAVLLHQWHPASPEAGDAAENRAYFERVTAAGQVVRNGGHLVPPDEPSLAPLPAAPRARKIVVATRSMSAELYRLSGEFLTFDGPGPAHRVRVTDAGSLEYFRHLAGLDADWVVNLDEDAFLLDPAGLLALIDHMEAGGYAACGVPDGGAVSIRVHNPAACNAFFNVFDLRRCRAAWADWDRVAALRHAPEYERALAPFGPTAPFAFDDFEPYYGVFFALLGAGERVLRLGAETWRDGTSTLVRGPNGPLVLHAWYAREWGRDPETRARYEAVIAFARAHRACAGTGADGPLPEVPNTVLAKTLVGLVVYDRIANAERWLAAWHRSAHGPARLAVVHNRDRADPVATRAITAGRPDAYVPRENVGFDIGAFQDVVTGRFAGALPDWEYLLWCTDDFVPVRPDFLLRFLDKARDPGVGLVAGRFGYWPGHWSGLESERHCRTVGFLVRRDVAERLRFPVAKVVTRDQCLAFEHRPGHLMEQVLALGYRVASLDDADARVMWDADHEVHLDRWPEYAKAFGAAPKGGRRSGAAPA